MSISIVTSNEDLPTTLSREGYAVQRRKVLLIRSDECGWTEVECILKSIRHVRLVAQARTIVRARDVVVGCQPDVIISALRVDGISVLPLLSKVHWELAPRCQIIVVTSHVNLEEWRAFADLGGISCLVWGDLSSQTLQHSLAASISGEVVVASRDVVASMLTARRRIGGCDGEVNITGRERALLGLLAHGLTYKQIAQREPLSQRSVERLAANLEAKLGAASQFELAIRAMKLGLIP